MDDYSGRDIERPEVTARSFEDQLALYQRANMPKNAILERIESQFGLEYKLRAESILLKKEESKTGKKRKPVVAFAIMALTGLVIIVVSYFLLISFMESPDFNSSKCTGTAKIAVNGDTSFKQKISGALTLVESKDCNYLRFISANAPIIYSGNTGVTGTGFYDNLKNSMAPDYSGSSYFVADAIIREACLSFQQKNGSITNEHDCGITQYNFLLRIGAPKEDIDRVLNLKNSPAYYFDQNNSDVFVEWMKQN